MVHLVSVGSAVVAGIALWYAVFQTVETLTVRATPGGLWPVGVSLGLAVYAAAVFVQYNAEAITTQLIVERIQYLGLILTVVSIHGYVRVFRLAAGGSDLPISVYTGIAALCAAAVLVIPGAFTTPLVERTLVISDFVYREPQTGLVGMVVFAILGTTSFLGVFRFFSEVPYRGVTGILVRGGLAIWFVTAINDIAGSLGATVPMYLLEYGFLAFLVGVIATIRQGHSDTVALVESQRTAIDQANRRLEVEVARRTEQLANVADGLRAKMREQRVTAAELERKNHEREVLIKEIHHRSKNNLQMVSSLLNLSVSHGASHTLEEIVELQQNRINAMAAVHEQLYASSDLASIDLAEYVRTLIGQIEASHRTPGLDIEFCVSLSSFELSLERAIPLGLWANEVITNALQHAFVDRTCGTIAISLVSQSTSAVLEISDDGVGLPLDPNGDTNAPLGLGTILIESLPAQIGAQLELPSYEQGSAYRLRFEKLALASRAG